MECKTRKEQRNLPDAVAIQHVIIVMGGTLRGIFRLGQTFPNWNEFVNDLKPKFMLHNAYWSLFLESEQLNMRGEWHGFHSVVHAYKLCLDPSLHPALMVNVIKALD